MLSELGVRLETEGAGLAQISELPEIFFLRILTGKFEF